MPSFTLGYRFLRAAEHRQNKRLTLPVFAVRIGAQLCATENWSLGGLLIKGYRGPAATGMTFVADIWPRSLTEERLTQDDILRVSLIVVRFDAGRKALAVRFPAITPTLLDFFERSFTAQRRRGPNR